MHWVAHVRTGPQRVNHAAAAVGDRIFTFGGYCSDNMSLYLIQLPMDVHVLHKNHLKWLEVPKPQVQLGHHNNTPFLRYGHTAVAYGTKIYIWGGRNDQSGCNRLFCFDTDTFMWSSPQTTGDIPCPRDGHSACIIGNTMYIYGGFETEFDNFSKDVFGLNLDTYYWTFIDTRGYIPPYTDFHTATAIGNRMYIFGGRSDLAAPNSSNVDFYLNNVIFLDVNTKVWVKPATTGDVPIGRRSHSAFLHRDKLYIFGGYNGTTKEHFNDIYCFNPQNNSWHKVSTFGTSPKKRRRQVCVVVEDKLYIFGGTSPNERQVHHNHFTHNYGFPQGYNLVDHNDLHVLDMNPSLKTLCMINIINNDRCYNHLPVRLREDLSALKSAMMNNV